MDEESKVLLNGEYVNADQIDPARHRFLGYFRPPRNPMLGHKCDVVICSCGASLWTVEECQSHYREGCCDVMQYVNV